MARTTTAVRLEGVQILRGVAALLVVFVHAVYSSDTLFGAGAAWLSRSGNLHQFGACGVDMFFVISGFVMAYTIEAMPRREPVRFFVQRFLRVVPYYWFVITVFFVAMWTAGHDFEAPRILDGFALFPIAQEPYYVIPLLPVSWSLGFELAFYSVVAVAIAIAPKRERRWRVALQLVLLMAAIGDLSRPERNLVAVWFNAIWLEFALGLLSYRIWNACRTRELGHLPLGLVACGTSILVGTAAFGTWFSDNPGLLLGGATGLDRTIGWGAPSAMILLGMLFVQDRSRMCETAPGRALRAVGDASYSLYLVHLLVIYLIEDTGAVAWIAPDVAIAAEVLLSTAIAIVVHRGVERPMLRLFKRCRRPPASVAALASA